MNHDDGTNGTNGTNGHEISEHKEIRRYMQEHFGESDSSFLYSPDEQQRLFGRWVKIIRESRSPEERISVRQLLRQARHPNKAASKAADKAAKTTRQDHRSKCLSQASLSYKATTAWRVLFGEPYNFDDRLIRKIEAGEQSLTGQLVLCLAVALRADRKEIAILFEAAGHNGWDWYKTQLSGFGGSILTYIEDGASEYDYEKLKATEILHVLKLRMDAEITDAQQD